MVATIAAARASAPQTLAHVELLARSASPTVAAASPVVRADLSCCRGTAAGGRRAARTRCRPSRSSEDDAVTRQVGIPGHLVQSPDPDCDHDVCRAKSDSVGPTSHRPGAQSRAVGGRIG